MNREPYRAPQPASRGPASRPTASRPATAAAHQDEPSVAPVHRAPTVHHTAKAPKSRKKVIIPIIIAAVILLAIAGCIAWSKLRTASPSIDSSKYQAVFFTSGQVYFGRLHNLNDRYLKLTDIFYIQAQQSETGSEKDSKNPQETSTNQNNVQLIKLGDEVHGPEDAMIIERSQVLFYENLKNDGKVAQAIQQHESSKN